MNNDFDKMLIRLEREVADLKQSMLKWAGVIGIADNPLSATFTIGEVSYDLFSTQAYYITAISRGGESFLSQLLFSGSWDGRGWACRKVYESGGKTKWCLAMVNARNDDYERYYSSGAFDVGLNILIRTTSAVDIITEWGDNPYASVW